LGPEQGGGDDGDGADGDGHVESVVARPAEAGEVGRDWFAEWEGFGGKDFEEGQWRAGQDFAMRFV